MHSPPHMHAHSLRMDALAHLARKGVREISIDVGAGAEVGMLRIGGALKVAGPEQMFYSDSNVSCCHCSLQESNRID